MKKQVLVFSLLFISLISTVAAVEIKLNKEVYAPSETLQAEIYGNFLDTLKPENIYFYRERNIPAEYDILKLKDKYLLYALLPIKEGNYSLKIKDTRYEEEGIVSESDIIKTFRIEKTNETSLSINPGFVVAREDFYIKVKASKNTDIETEFLGQKETISLVKGKEEKIYFSISAIKNYTEAAIKIQDYAIPVFIFPEKTVGIKETAKFRFNPSKISAIILKEEEYSFKVSLTNFGNKNISNIELFSNISDSDLEIEIAPDSISVLEAKDRKFINLTFSSEKKGDFSGEIVALAGNLSTELNIDIEVTEDKSAIIYNASEISPGYTEEETCAKLGGKFCKVDEKCSVPLELTLEGYCCKGECAAEKKSSSWIYGLIIIIAIVAALIFFSFYMKKKQKKAIDILKQREKKYQERMSASEEVRGSLTKT